MKKLTRTLLILVFFTCTYTAYSQGKEVQTTICNPINLSYRFCLDGNIPRREAADPTMVVSNNGRL